MCKVCGRTHRKSWPPADVRHWMGRHFFYWDGYYFFFAVSNFVWHNARMDGMLYKYNTYSSYNTHHSYYILFVVLRLLRSHNNGHTYFRMYIRQLPRSAKNVVAWLGAYELIFMMASDKFCQPQATRLFLYVICDVHTLDLSSGNGGCKVQENYK